MLTLHCTVGPVPWCILPSSEAFGQVLVSINSLQHCVAPCNTGLPRGSPPHLLLTNTAPPGNAHLHAGWETEEASVTAWPWQLAWAGMQRLSFAVLCPVHQTWPLPPASIIWKKWKGFPSAQGIQQAARWLEGGPYWQVPCYMGVALLILSLYLKA